MASGRAIRQIIVCAAVLIVFCFVCRFTVFNSYSVYVPLGNSREGNTRPEDMQVDVEKPEVLRSGETKIQSGYLKIPVKPEKEGDTFIIIRDSQGDNVGSRHLRVGPMGTVYDLSSGGFTGDTAVIFAVPLFAFLVSAIMLWHFFRAKGPAFYSYSTIYYAGFSLFALIAGLVMLSAALLHIMNPRQNTMYVTYGVIRSASGWFMQLTTPLVVAFALSMIVCNIALLCHEKPRIQNVLGILISILMLAGEALGWYFFTRKFSGSMQQARVIETLLNTYATVFVYFECMLMGSIICGLMAAGHKPKHDKAFIVILGCWFRKDGSLPPLLKGRVDRAIAFWKEQKDQTGTEAVLIPSGGQGPGESMPEAAAMRRYLLKQGIPEERIRPEEKAANTYQNMEFSGQIAREIDPEGKVIFSTTNYHVFRSGIWAGLAGLPAEGIGSRTKWWFWPNAFMREVIGLLVNRWKQELAFLAVLIVFFGLLSIVLW